MTIKSAMSIFFDSYKNSNFIDQQRAKALFYIASISSLLILVVTIISFQNHQDNVSFWQHATIPFSMILLTAGSLTLLYKGKLNLAGNLLITGVLLLQTYSLFDRLYNNPVYQNFIGGTYYWWVLKIHFSLS